LRRYTKALSEFESIVPPTEDCLAHAASCYNNIGMLQWQMGQHDAALTAYRSALRIREELHGKAHPIVASQRNNIAIVLAQQGLLDEAIIMWKTVAAMQREHGAPVSELANTYNNMGVVLKEQGKVVLAIKMHQAALELRGSPVGPDAAVADVLYNLACCSSLASKGAAALDYLAKAVDAGFDDVAQLRRNEDLKALRNFKKPRFDEIVKLASTKRK
jgi:tetratricopeptide (TPR) repeat protein